MPSGIRFYLQRDDGEIWLVVERVSDKRGWTQVVRNRREAHVMLKLLTPLVESIVVDPPLPVRTYDPVEADDPLG